MVDIIVEADPTTDNLECVNGNVAVQEIIDHINDKVMLSGDTMLGPLEVVAGGTGSQAIQADEIDQKILESIDGIEIEIKLDEFGDAIVKSDDSWITNNCTAWGHFNGKTGAIKTGYNFGTLEIAGNGIYVVKFDTPLNIVDYTVVCNVGDAYAYANADGEELDGFGIYTKNHDGAWINDADVSFIVIGGKV